MEPQSLDYLIAKGMIDEEFKPINIPEFKIVKSGVIMQQRTHVGIPYDIVISWLQKAIRRNRYDDCVYCMYLITRLDTFNKPKTMFRSHLLNRLITILSEDIGIADSCTEFIYKRYFSLLHTEVSEEYLGRTLCEMAYVLCRARKSRYTDWIIHAVMWDQDPGKAPKQLVDFLKDPSHKFTVDAEDKQISLLWNLAKHRGKEYGHINLVHAVLATLFKDELRPEPTEAELLAGFSFSLDVWHENDMCRPIYNPAVDKHTFWGRRYLGRGMHYFGTQSAILEPHHPFLDESFLLKQFISYVKPKQKLTVSPFDHQKTIIKNTVEEFGNHKDKDITIQMATGTGKTFTSFWIMQRNTNRNDTILVVCPTHDILDQFLKDWSQLFSIPTIVGILSSRHYNYNKTTLFNYEYIDDKKGIKRFLEYPRQIVGRKIIFTTYSSLQRKIKEINDAVTFSLYDESHYCKNSHIVSNCRRIFLSATPSRASGVVLTYGIQKAIDEGSLVPFTVCMMPQDWSEQDSLDFITSQRNKTIVYSQTNVVSKSIYDSVNIPNKSFISCNTAKRREILEKFKQAERGVIFNCSLLSTGVNIPDCDSVYIHGGKVGYKPLIQVLGRCLRKFPGKESATVYMQYDDRYNYIKRIRHIREAGCVVNIEEVC